jgi:GNAT superfamily N-acetyltransferase
MNTELKRGGTMKSFDYTAAYSTCIDENEFFKQYYNKDAHFRYDSNFFQLKYQPSLQEFELIEEMQEHFHKEKGLEHMKFYWPENQGLTPEIMRYFEEQNYALEFLELYQLDPLAFQPTRSHSHVKVVKVTKDTLADFKRISYPEDTLFGEDFARLKQGFYDWQFKQPSISFLLAFIDEEAVGTLTMIEEKETIEIDDVQTIEAYRKQGIATALQSFVVKEARKKNKTILLIADGEDTPKDMYQRQGYQYVSYKIGAQKVFDVKE